MADDQIANAGRGALAFDGGIAIVTGAASGFGAEIARRFCLPEDVADAALYLAKAEFLTGVELPVDGGRTI